jgi:hypothetical protein
MATVANVLRRFSREMELIDAASVEPGSFEF